jgi:NAD(P)H dehydrogenase (quinone)
VILAHPEPRSFNGSWAKATVEAAKASGGQVLFSDLVSMGFDPVEKESHYEELKVASSVGPFDPLKMQDLAANEHCLPTDVAAEILKIKSADRIVFHFPLWWFGPPAILKGWFDRCLVHGELHTSQQRFDAGLFVGKKVLFCVSTGSTALESSPAGKEGDVNLLLWPLAYALRYLGFSVLQPVVVHGVHGFHQGEAKISVENRLEKTLIDQKALISTFDDMPLIQFNSDSDFDDAGTLRATATSHNSFIRHELTPND